MNFSWIKIPSASVKAAFLVLAAALPVAFYLKTYDSVAIKSTILQLGTIAALAAWLAGALAARRFEVPARTLPFVLPAAGLFLWNLARFAASQYRVAALDGFLTQEIFLLSFILIPLNFPKENFRQLVLAAVGGWAVVVLYGLAQNLGVDPFIWRGSFGTNIFSTIGNPDYLAAYLVAASPLALAVTADVALAAPLRAASGILSAASGLVIVMTGAAPEIAVYLAAITGFIVMTAFRAEPAGRKFALLAAGLAVAVCAVFLIFQRPKPSAFSSFGRATSAIRSSSFEMAKRTGWLGTGPGSFWVHFPAFRSQEVLLTHQRHNIITYHTGNEPLEQWIEGGLPGLLLWSLLFVIVLYKGFPAVSGEFGGYAGALFVSVAGSLAVAMISLNSPRSPAVGWLLYFNAGLLALLASQRSSKPDKTLAIPVPFAALRWLLLGVVAAGACWGAVFSLRMFNSEMSHNMAIFHSKNDNWDAAIEAYGKETPGSQVYLMGQYFIGKVFQDRGAPGDLEKAVAQYGKLRRLAPDYVQADYSEGLALKKLGKYVQAISCLERQVRIDPVWEDAWLELAGLYKENGDLQKAENAMRRAAEAKALWGTVAGRTSEAKKEYGVIGIKARVIKGDLFVEEIYHDSPADKAGLRPGDRIFEITARPPAAYAGKDRQFQPRKFTMEKAAQALIGELGTEVTLIVRPLPSLDALKSGKGGEGKVKIIQLKRARTTLIPDTLSWDEAIQLMARSGDF